MNKILQGDWVRRQTTMTSSRCSKINKELEHNSGKHLRWHHSRRLLGHP